MKKSLVVLLLALTFAFALASCGTISLEGALRGIGSDIADSMIASPAPATVGTAQKEPPAAMESTPPTDPRAAVLDAVERNDLDALKAALAGEDDVKAVIGEDIPILCLAERAAGSGQKNLVSEYLVSKGAFILQKDETGMTFDQVIAAQGMDATPRHEYAVSLVTSKSAALSDALRNDSVDSLKKLRGARAFDGELLLYATDEKASAIVAFLIADGVKAGYADPRTGENALHKACNGRPYDRSFDSRASLVATLLKAGVDPLAKDSKGNTPLASLLLAAGKDPSRKMGSPARLAMTLINAGCPVDGVVDTGATLLAMAVRTREKSLVAALLDKGAPLDEKAYLDMNLGFELARLFVERGVDPGRYAGFARYIAEEDRLEFVRFLLASGVPASSIDPLTVYATFDIVRLLADAGADFSSSGILHALLLTKAGIEKVRFVVEHGADVNLKNVAGARPLHLAVQSRDLESVRFLVSSGADVNADNARGQTPLDLCPASQKAMAEFLVSRGAKNSS
ncbi:MAG: ankyrin repeat domain-containing protein [Spirochaetes bacterium]|nr:ankyrin repeat domain-containing protein [Spirochaetota bacterium]MBU1079939.1 ankyrin repeat domain-containing protein [Spirochaetota bacterium]